MLPIEPRPLSAEERILLEFLFSAEFSGCEALRSQLDSVTVDGTCECGCGTVSLKVVGSSGKAAVEKTIPVEAYGDLLDVILLVQNGFISSLELVFYDDRLPRLFPNPRDLKLWARPLHKTPMQDPTKTSS